MDPKVSIIVPVYNVENYIKECLDSLIGQSMKEIEIILVDDGSTDFSGMICEQYAKNDSRIKVIHQKNTGQSAARNRGMNIATGKYIMFVDSDDYIARNACEVLFQTAEKNTVEVIAADLLNEKEQIMTTDFRKIKSENIVINGNEFVKEKIITTTYDIVLVLYFISRSFIDRVHLRFKEGLFYEDQLWTMQLLSQTKSIIKIRYPFYFYRMDRSGSTTNKMYLKKGTDAATICNCMSNYLNSIEENDYKRYYHTILLMSVFQFVRVWLRLSRSDRKIAAGELKKETIENALKYDMYYQGLYDVVSDFYKCRTIFALKNDVHMFIRKVIKR